MEPLADDAPPPRLLLPSDRADLRATWHPDRASLVVSLWHDRLCAASAPLSLEQTARLAGFLVDHLARQAMAADAHRAGEARGQPAGEPDAGQAGGADAAPTGAAGDASGNDVGSSEEAEMTVPIELPREPHLRPAPEPGAGQRAGAAIDEAIAAGGAALTAAVEAARHTWRQRRG